MDKENFYRNFNLTKPKIEKLLDDIDIVCNEVSLIVEMYKTEPKKLSKELSIDRMFDIRKDIKNTLNFITLTYSLYGVRLDIIYNRGKTYNGSEEGTKYHLLSATKLLVLSNMNIYEELSDSDKQYFVCFFLLKFMLNINNTMTFNLQNQLPVYSPLNKYCISSIILSIISLINSGNYKIYDIQGNVKTLKPNKRETMQRFNKETLTNHINDYVNSYGNKPTISELFNYINDVIFNRDKFETDDEYNNTILKSSDVLKYYIKTFDLKDLMNIKTYKKKDNTKQ